MHGIIDHFPRVSRLTVIRRKLLTAWNAILRFVGAILRIQFHDATTQPVRYPLTSKQEQAREKFFIDSIDRDAVRRLASRHKSGEDCRVLRSDQGSFNACFFVQFNDDTRWVVRIPIEPAVYDTWGKLQREVATMQYIRNETAIPIPHVYAWGREILTHEPTQQAYIILEYVPGHSLDVRSFVRDTRERRAKFYSQLIDIYADMRQLELSSAGSLMPDPTVGPEIIGPLCSMHINEMQCQGFNSAAPLVAFTSTTEFILHQLSIMAKAYTLPISEPLLEVIQREVFALEHLRRVLLETNTWDETPFIFCHLDLREGNIIVDDDLNIISIIDWEWAGSIPRQFFTPPSWIAGQGPSHITGPKYRAEFEQFHEVLLAKSEVSDAHYQLAKEWDLQLLDRTELPVAQLLHHHSRLSAIFFRSLYPKLFEAPEEDVISEFFNRHQERASEAHQRFESSQEYTQDLKDSGLFVPDKRKELDLRMKQLQNLR